MIEVSDIPPINPVLPKKSVVKKQRQQQQSNTPQKKSQNKEKRDRDGRGHIDEFA